MNHTEHTLTLELRSGATPRGLAAGSLLQSGLWVPREERDHRKPATSQVCMAKTKNLGYNASMLLKHQKALPNPSLKLTRYGMRCKPGVCQFHHRHTPGLQRTPPRAA